MSCRGRLSSEGRSSSVRGARPARALGLVAAQPPSEALGIGTSRVGPAGRVALQRSAGDAGVRRTIRLGRSYEGTPRREPASTGWLRRMVWGRPSGPWTVEGAVGRGRSRSFTGRERKRSSRKPGERPFGSGTWAVGRQRQRYGSSKGVWVEQAPRHLRRARRSGVSGVNPWPHRDAQAFGHVPTGSRPRRGSSSLKTELGCIRRHDTSTVREREIDLGPPVEHLTRESVQVGRMQAGRDVEAAIPRAHGGNGFALANTRDRGTTEGVLEWLARIFLIRRFWAPLLAVRVIRARGFGCGDGELARGVGARVTVPRTATGDVRGRSRAARACRSRDGQRKACDPPKLANGNHHAISSGRVSAN